MAISKEAKKAYDAARYIRDREIIKVKRAAYYDAHREEEKQRHRDHYYANRAETLRRQKIRRSRPEIKEQRKEYFRVHNLLRRYGTAEPYPGMPSLTGKRHYHVGDECPCHQQRAAKMLARAIRSRIRSLARSATPKPAKPTGEKRRSAATPRKASITRPATAPSSPSKSRTTPAELWTPVPAGVTIVPFKPRKITYLCSVGHPFSTKRQADKHSEYHYRVASVS